VLALGILISPTSSYAAGLTSVQINSILTLLSAFGADSATIANVTVALNGGTPSSTASRSFCHTWNADLTVGSTGDDVSALNQALTASGIDTTGNTSSFSENNAGDVVAFQSHYGIRQTGYVGPMTRAKLNALYGCSSSQTNWTTTPTTSTNPPVTAVLAPVIQSVQYSAATSVSGEKFVVIGKNLTSTSQLQYADILTGNTNGSGQLTYMLAYGPSEIDFAGNTYTGNVASVYKVTLVDKVNGFVSNTVTVDTRAPATAVTAPVITSTTAKAAGNLEMDAGGVATISGTGLYSSDKATKVLIGGREATITYTSDTLLNITVPSSLTAGESYSLYVMNGNGMSNTLTVKILSVLTAATATIDSSSLKQYTGKFSITGTASNSTGVVVLLEPLAYSATRDFATVDGQVGKDGYYRAYSSVTNGRWSINLAYDVSNSFFVLVYDTNSKMLLTTGTLNISSSGPVTCNLYAGSYTASPYTYVPGQVYVVPGSSVTLFWESQNATSGVWSSGDKAGTSGSVRFSNLALGANTWSINFSGSGGSKTCSTTVYVDQKG